MLTREKLAALALLQANYAREKIARKRKLRAKQMMLFCLFRWSSQRKIMLMNTMFAALVLRERRFWRHSRRDYWFHELLRDRHHPDYLDRWMSIFRLRPTSFDTIVNLVRNSIGKADTNYRKAIRVPHRVAIALMRLGTGGTMRMIAETLSVGPGTVCKICIEFCTCLSSLKELFISFPRGHEDILTAIENFASMDDCQINMAVGAVDGTHLPIIAPPEHKVDYYNRKQRYSFNTQAIVGAGLLFYSVSTGFPGSIHDARAFRTTTTFQEIENGNLLDGPAVLIRGVNVKPLLLGDSAYGLNEWLMAPYSNPIDVSQRNFNRELSKARASVERGFGVLKARWRCLMKRLDNKIENVSDVIMSCFILHNLCQLCGDYYEGNDIDFFIELERNQRPANPIQRPMNRQNGILVRDALAEELELRP